MFKKVLKQFSTAIALVVLALASMLYFMKSSKPAEAPLTSSSDAAHKHASSKDHEQCAANLAGKNLPKILLQNIDKTSFSPVEMSEKKPIIVIRYLGYGCSHCIEQLLALQKFTDRLKAGQIRVIAFSDDLPEQNQTVVQKYAFDPAVFTFAFDPAKSLARSIGAVYREEDGAMTELHVSLIVRAGGRVDFANFDTKPYMDVENLVNQVIKSL
jgi:thioredoxin-dependent peroxiredoxin